MIKLFKYFTIKPSGLGILGNGSANGGAGAGEDEGGAAVERQEPQLVGEQPGRCFHPQGHAAPASSHSDPLLSPILP